MEWEKSRFNLGGGCSWSIVATRYSQNLVPVAGGSSWPYRRKTGDTRSAWESNLSSQKLMWRSVISAHLALAPMMQAAAVIDMRLDALTKTESTVHAREY
ncbi:hypothetical protein [Syntrophothermus sp.]|uniref:hypothetical protein n=1 Tax=Syntrophothermus sp. TaxID=2736299 RepID=UPI00257A4D0D|nr:hypothetical protein [Syntrophothermus sp.]